MFKLLSDMLFVSFIGMIFYFVFFRNYVGIGLDNYNIGNVIGKNPINIEKEFKITKISYYRKNIYNFDSISNEDCDKIKTPFFVNKTCDFDNNKIIIETTSMNFLL